MPYLLRQGLRGPAVPHDAGGGVAAGRGLAGARLDHRVAHPHCPRSLSSWHGNPGASCPARPFPGIRVSQGDVGHPLRDLGRHQFKSSITLLGRVHS